MLQLCYHSTSHQRKYKYVKLTFFFIMMAAARVQRELQSAMRCIEKVTLVDGYRTKSCAQANSSVTFCFATGSRQSSGKAAQRTFVKYCCMFLTVRQSSLLSISTITVGPFATTPFSSTATFEKRLQLLPWIHTNTNLEAATIILDVSKQKRSNR